MNAEDKDALMGLLLRARNRANEAVNAGFARAREIRDLIDSGISFVEVS